MTVTRSETARISSNLCVIKMMDFPSLTRFFMICSSSSISEGVNTAVGSSKIKISAPRYNVFKISTRCCAPTEISSTFAVGSTAKPYFSDSSLMSLIAFRISKTPFLVVSLPKMIFSATVKASTSMKCW